MDNINQIAQHIKLVIFDVDGVLTDGRIYFSDSGHEFKAFHSQDGMGIKMLMQAGLEVAIITARQSNLVEKRAKELGLKHVYQNQNPKTAAFEELKSILKLDNHEIAYVGDDLVDLPLIIQSGLGIAVANAAPFVKQHATWCTTCLGGQGAVREVVELILTAQEKLSQVHEAYLV